MFVSASEIASIEPAAGLMTAAAGACPMAFAIPWNPD